MANSESAKKRIRQAEKRRERNRSHRSPMRTEVKKLRAAIEAGDVETARAMLVPTCSLVDHTAQRGVIHPNAASRTKSRLTRAVNALVES